MVYETWLNTLSQKGGQALVPSAKIHAHREIPHDRNSSREGRAPGHARRETERSRQLRKKKESNKKRMESMNVSGDDAGYSSTFEEVSNEVAGLEMVANRMGLVCLTASHSPSGVEDVGGDHQGMHRVLLAEVPDQICGTHITMKCSVILAVIAEL